MDGIKLNIRGPGTGVFLQLREDQRPRPLDQARRRQSLSETPAYNQSQSPLFKLPIEIRQVIYVEAGLASNTTIHCFTHTTNNQKHGAPRPAGRIVGKLCTLPPNLAIPYSNPAAHPHCPPCWLKAQQALSCRPDAFTDYDLEGTSPSITPLLQTCRRIYTEATPTLYATNAFTFTDTWTLHDFLTCAIVPAHAARIWHLELTWTLFSPIDTRFYPRAWRPHSAATWRGLWARVGADMRGLRRLRLELSDRVGRNGCRTGAGWRGGWRGGPVVRRRDGEGEEEEGEEREYDGDPKALWLEWLGPVGKALEGREEGVEVEGGIWCRLDVPESRHAVIKGEGGRRVLVLTDGEEVEW